MIAQDGKLYSHALRATAQIKPAQSSGQGLRVSAQQSFFAVYWAYTGSDRMRRRGVSSTGVYSPCFNDIWSLSIIPLNLATGPNPWKSATSSDPTFQANLRDPCYFLSSVLPIPS
ncbi:hypothetical protein JOM56_000438 [Amanita muscaria]